MIRAALIGTLVGLILGGGAVAALSIPVLQEHTAELQIIAMDVHAIRKYSNINAEAVLDGAVRADAIAQARANAMKPAGKKLRASR